MKGGLKGAYHEKSLRVLPEGANVYELHNREYEDSSFPRKWEGKLIKCMYYHLEDMQSMPNGIRIVVMRRNVEEIGQSHKVFFGSMGHFPNLDRRIDETVKKMREREDIISIHEFPYRAVVGLPEYYFEILRKSGWAIDIKKASDAVDPSLCHWKLEERDASCNKKRN